jgi:hypothetical protein
MEAQLICSECREPYAKLTDSRPEGGTELLGLCSVCEEKEGGITEEIISKLTNDFDNGSLNAYHQFMDSFEKQIDSYDRRMRRRIPKLRTEEN